MNSRVAIAVHVLTLLAQAEGRPLTSEFMAGSINTHASVVRRVLSGLAKAGLTTSQMGTGGGALLARLPEHIHLLDVQRAVDDGDVFGLHDAPNPDCLVGRHIQAALDVHFRAAQQALEAELARSTIADVLAEVLAQERRRSPRARPAAP